MATHVKMVSVNPRQTVERWIEPQVSVFEGRDVKQELRVLQVFSVLGVGGAETWLMSLLRYFREQNDSLPVKVKFDILLTGGRKAVFDEEASALGARLFYVPFTRRTAISFVRQFRRILAEGNYDAIHDHQDYIGGLHFLMGAGLLPRIRVAHVHNPLLHLSNYLTGASRRLTSAVGRRGLRYLATDIVGTSQQVLQEYGFSRILFPNARLGAVHCGFSVSEFRDDSNDARRTLRAELELSAFDKIVLFVGRLSSHRDPKLNQKNPLFALEVVKAAISLDSTINLIIAGGGESAQDELKAKVQSWGLQKNIHFLGVRRDIPRLMLCSDLLLFPSLAEGLGMVVVEAQAAGLRVLASDTTPQECVVLPSLVEFLPLGASSERWADEVVRLINLPQTDRKECNEQVNQSPFSIQSSATRLMSVYAGPV